MNELYLLVESADIAAARAILAYDAYQKMDELNMREAELTCLYETGDVQELDAYFSEARADASTGKEKNILQRLWKAVKELFQKIKTAMFGRREKKTGSKEKVRVPKIFAHIVKFFSGAWNRVKSLVLAGKKRLSEDGNWKKLLAVLGVAAAGVTLAAVWHHKAKGGIEEVEEVTVQQIEDFEDAAEDATDTCQKIAAKGEQNPDSCDAENARSLRQLGNALKHPIRTGKVALRKAKGLGAAVTSHVHMPRRSKSGGGAKTEGRRLFGRRANTPLPTNLVPDDDGEDYGESVDSFIDEFLNGEYDPYYESEDFYMDDEYNY